MEFAWSSKYHGQCVVKSRLGSETASVSISWMNGGRPCELEYRLPDVADRQNGLDDRRRLEQAVRLAMAHFESTGRPLPGLLNLAIDSTTVSWEGKLPSIME
jgi:hypothetical protein